MRYTPRIIAIKLLLNDKQTMFKHRIKMEVPFHFRPYKIRSHQDIYPEGKQRIIKMLFSEANFLWDYYYFTYYYLLLLLILVVVVERPGMLGIIIYYFRYQTLRVSF